VLARSTIQLLRFHFSLFLMPVFLFAVSQAPEPDVLKTVLAFVILHFLVYPSSNGYNSYMDRDETPIGGLSAPLQPTRELFFTSVVMDIAAVLISLFISVPFAVGILLYIIASRAYSYRGIRLKQYPVTGFLTVFLFQGAWIFYISYAGISKLAVTVPLIPCIISSCLIGALYPLTQIYQHEADRKDGVTTISYVLGKNGSFLFSLILFLLATALLYVHFQSVQQIRHFYRFLFIMLPVVLFFLYWMIAVRRDQTLANFKNSLRMNLLSTLCTTIYFITLIVANH
jgi:1,4-dihydroxy-2-naphthoate octaprenyltransferase